MISSNNPRSTCNSWIKKPRTTKKPHINSHLQKQNFLKWGKQNKQSQKVTTNESKKKNRTFANMFRLLKILCVGNTPNTKPIHERRSNDDRKRSRTEGLRSNSVCGVLNCSEQSTTVWAIRSSWQRLKEGSENGRTRWDLWEIGKGNEPYQGKGLWLMR